MRNTKKTNRGVFINTGNQLPYERDKKYHLNGGKEKGFIHNYMDVKRCFYPQGKPGYPQKKGSYPQNMY
jgi:hypothetical protein